MARQVGAYKLPNALRVTIASEEANRAVRQGAGGIRGALNVGSVYKRMLRNPFTSPLEGEVGA